MRRRSAVLLPSSYRKMLVASLKVNIAREQTEMRNSAPSLRGGGSDQSAFTPPGSIFDNLVETVPPRQKSSTVPCRKIAES